MPFQTIEIDPEFLATLISKKFGDGDRRRILRALELLDTDERHPSLRVHALKDDLLGYWSASASDDLRILFVRLPNGRKRVDRCTRHYDR